MTASMTSRIEHDRLVPPDRGDRHTESAAPAECAPPGDYTALMGMFPTGVAVITSVDGAGRPHGITCSSLTSVTLSPPTLLVCIRSSSPTLDALMTAGGFAVNLLHTGASATATLFGTPVADRFARVGWRPSATGLPWLHADALALAECRLGRAFPVGDHVVVLGEVLTATRYDGAPLLYGLRQFLPWPADPGRPAAPANGELHD